MFNPTRHAQAGWPAGSLRWVAPPRLQGGPNDNQAGRYGPLKWPAIRTGTPSVVVEEGPLKISRLEAVLFLAKEAQSLRKLAQLATLTDGTEARTLIAQLNESYQAANTSFHVEQVAGGYQLMTLPRFSRWLRRLQQTQVETRLSAPALETLAVIAYRQPILRADVEAVRGVQCGELLRQLMERDLVRIAGKSSELGRPFLYGTTKRFLQVFGLRDLTELPPVEKPTLENTPPHNHEQLLEMVPHEEELAVKTRVRPDLIPLEQLDEEQKLLVPRAVDDDDDDIDDDDFDDDDDDDDEDLDVEDDEDDDADDDDGEWEEVDDEDEEEDDAEDDEDDDWEDDDWEDDDDEDDDDDWEEDEEEDDLD